MDRVITNDELREDFDETIRPQYIDEYIGQ